MVKWWILDKRLNQFKLEGLSHIYNNKDILPLFLLAVLITTFSPLSSIAEGLKEMRVGQMRIHYSPSLIRGAEEIRRIYSYVKVKTGEKLGINIDINPVIYLIHDREFRKRSGGLKLITAFAIPRSSAIVINYSRMKNSSIILRQTLMHELCHLMLHEYIERPYLPKWFDEGVCQWVSGGMADIIDFDSKRVLKEAVITNNYISLDALRHRFPSQDKALILSYSESRSIIEYIDETYGTDGLLSILKMLYEGRDINDAIRGSLSISLKELEKKWHAHLKRRYTWYYFIADNILWILFILGALITVAGYIRMRIRMKRHFREEETFF